MKRVYSGREVAEAIMVYDELRRCGAVHNGVLDFEKVSSGYRNEGWTKDLDIRWPLAATVTEQEGGDQK